MLHSLNVRWQKYISREGREEGDDVLALADVRRKLDQALAVLVDLVHSSLCNSGNMAPAQKDTPYRRGYSCGS